MSTINLIPQDYLRQRMQRRVNFVSVILLAVVISGVIGAATVTDRSKNHTQDVRDRIQDEYGQAAKLIRQMQVLEARKAMMLDKAQLTAALVERVPRSTLLAIITNARPKGTSLLKVNLNTRVAKETIPGAGRLSPTGTTVLSGESRSNTAPRTNLVVDLAITGLAHSDADVAKFIANLAGNRLVETVDLTFSQEKIIDAAVVRQFQIRFTLRDDADAIDIAGKLPLKPKKPPAAKAVKTEEAAI